jgi:DNA (cytosine-5)-methyltransferase 1
VNAELLTCLELCAGAGGQAIGLERAGFEQAAAIELDADACRTLKENRPQWRVIQDDLREVDASQFRGVDLVAGGVPCPPFSIAGRQLGEADERDLFPTAIKIVREAKPDAVMLENVPGFASAKFSAYRDRLRAQLQRLGYEVDWQVLNACNFGVPQLRPRFILVALRPAAFHRFTWPEPIGTPPSVGEALVQQMAAGGWPGALAWAQKANGIGPTLVGGSKLHGGPDLGPTRAKRAWSQLAVDGRLIANAPPDKDFPVHSHPLLTVEMAARIQGFPSDWKFIGGKTSRYRQVGNAFPPPVAHAVARAIRKAVLRQSHQSKAAIG